jgi:hypothetical protein
MRPTRPNAIISIMRISLCYVTTDHYDRGLGLAARAVRGRLCDGDETRRGEGSMLLSP